MPLSLSEDFDDGLGSLEPVQGTWDADLGYARATEIPFEPEAIAVFKPGDSDYFYNSEASDPTGSFARFKIAAQGGSVRGTGFWLLSGGTDMSKPAVLLTGRPTGIRARYWTGSGMEEFTGNPKWFGSLGVGDVIRAEIINDECRIHVNGALELTFTDERLAIAGYHGVRIPHDSADSGIDEWRMGPLGQFTL